MYAFLHFPYLAPQQMSQIMSRVEIQHRRRLFDDFLKIDEVHLRHQKRDGGGVLEEGEDTSP